MKPKKPDRSVSEMDVLKDIRGLLSTAQEREGSPAAQLIDEGSLKAEVVQLQEQIGHYAELVQKQQEELYRLESENKELAAKLNLLRSGKDKPVSPAPRAEELCEEIAQLEARKAESYAKRDTYVESMVERANAGDVAAIEYLKKRYPEKLQNA